MIIKLVQVDAHQKCCKKSTISYINELYHSNINCEKYQFYLHDDRLFNNNLKSNIIIYDDLIVDCKNK